MRLSLFYFIALALLLTLSSCQMHHLSVQTQYITRENLASYHISTPDPQLDHPTIGQRLLIQWKFRACEVEGMSLTLHLKIRFRNHQEEDLVVPLENSCHVFVGGTYLYELVNEKYFEKGGILTYIAEIRHDEDAIAVWKHPLWVELIHF